MPRGRKKKLDGMSMLLDRPTPQIKTNISVDLVLTVRRISVGSFQGLWELCRIMPDGSTKVIIDATTKQNVCNLARNEIVRCST